MTVTGGVALFNLAVQLVLILAVLASGWLAYRRRLRHHCRLMRGVLLVQLLLTGVIMAPQIGRFFRNWVGFTRLNVELVIHMVFAVLALALAAYVSLPLGRFAKKRWRNKWVMRSTLVAWVVSLGLGIHLYWFLWR